MQIEWRRVARRDATDAWLAVCARTRARLPRSAQAAQARCPGARTTAAGHVGDRHAHGYDPQRGVTVVRACRISLQAAAVPAGAVVALCAGAVVLPRVVVGVVGAPARRRGGSQRAGLTSRSSRSWLACSRTAPWERAERGRVWNSNGGKTTAVERAREEQGGAAREGTGSSRLERSSVTARGSHQARCHAGAHEQRRRNGVLAYSRRRSVLGACPPGGVVGPEVDARSARARARVRRGAARRAEASAGGARAGHMGSRVRGRKRPGSEGRPSNGGLGAR